MSVSPTAGNESKQDLYLVDFLRVSNHPAKGIFPLCKKPPFAARMDAFQQAKGQFPENRSSQAGAAVLLYREGCWIKQDGDRSPVRTDNQSPDGCSGCP